MTKTTTTTTKTTTTTTTKITSNKSSSNTCCVERLKKFLESRFEYEQKTIVNDLVQSIECNETGSWTISQNLFVTRPIKDHQRRIVCGFWMDDVTMRWYWSNKQNNRQDDEMYDQQPQNVDERKEDKDGVETMEKNDTSNNHRNNHNKGNDNNNWDRLSVTLQSDNVYVYYIDRDEQQQGNNNNNFFIATAILTWLMDILMSDDEGHNTSNNDTKSSLDISLFFSNVLINVEAAEAAVGEEDSKKIQLGMNDVGIVLKQPQGPVQMRLFNSSSSSNNNNSSSSSSSNNHSNDGNVVTLEAVLPFQITIEQLVVPRFIKIHQFIVGGVIDQQSGAIYDFKIPTCQLAWLKSEDSIQRLTAFQEYITHSQDKELWMDYIYTPCAAVNEVLFQFFSVKEHPTEQTTKGTAAAPPPKSSFFLRPPKKLLLNKYQGSVNDTIGTLIRYYIDIFLHPATAAAMEEDDDMSQSSSSSSQRFQTKFGDKLGGAVIRSFLGVPLITPMGAALGVAGVVAHERVKTMLHENKNKKEKIKQELELVNLPDNNSNNNNNETTEELTFEEKKAKEIKLKARMMGAVGSSVGAAIGLTLLTGPLGVIGGVIAGGLLTEHHAEKYMHRHQIQNKEANNES